jgi:hypothetical protein
VKWFRRLGDIPGLSFEANTALDRTKLPGYDATPQVQTYQFEGKRRESLPWPTEGCVGSASPAHQRAFTDMSNLSTAELLPNTYEGLELPGEPRDYHFLVQGCAQELWRRRREEPDTLDYVEKLCWLDIRLIEAQPAAIRDEYAEEPKFYIVSAFATLIGLYEHEGFLREALDVADRAAAFEQGAKDRERLRQRIKGVEAEDARQAL